MLTLRRFLLLVLLQVIVAFAYHYGGVNAAMDAIVGFFAGWGIRRLEYFVVGR